MRTAGPGSTGQEQGCLAVHPVLVAGRDRDVQGEIWRIRRNFGHVATCKCSGKQGLFVSGVNLVRVIQMFSDIKGWPEKLNGCG